MNFSVVLSGKILLTLILLCAAASVFGQSKTPSIQAEESRNISFYALRLTPGQDLRLELERFAKEKKIAAGFVATTVGSLQAAKIRLANQENSTAFEGKFEIVSLVGTVSQNGSHLHLSIADSTGKTIGGHLAQGCLIYTTAEIIVGASSDLVFTRETDPQTTYKELKIRRKTKRRPAGNK